MAYYGFGSCDVVSCVEDLVTPAKQLAKQLFAKQEDIENWFAVELKKQTLPFYCSVDLRVSDHKIAPVDANLFPGGFNNLAPTNHAVAAKAVAEIIKAQWPKTTKIAMIVEYSTRNPYYANHLGVLSDVIKEAGFELKLAFLEGEKTTLKGHHTKVNVDVISRKNDQISIDGCVPDLVLLNHDLTSGIPEILQGTQICIIPPPEAGWSTRRKSVHFFQYERVANRFANEFKLDSWQLQAYFNVCNKVDVSKSIGLDCLARTVEETLHDIKVNYERVTSNEDPFVVLKADAGTYGMGVVMLDSAEQTRSLNRRQRKNLSVVKDGTNVRDILIQEGVESSLRIEGLVAEPVIYMIGAKVVGGFWRLNQTHGPRENLNSRGMLFWPLKQEDVSKELNYAQQVVARLALLATARELAGQLAISNKYDF